jgi:hypothetical protein
LEHANNFEQAEAYLSSGQFQNFASVLELCRNAARIAKIKSELGAQRPALHSTAETHRKNASFKMNLSTLSLWLVAATTPRGRPAPGPPGAPRSDFVSDRLCQLKLSHYRAGGDLDRYTFLCHKLCASPDHFEKNLY